MAVPIISDYKSELHGWCYTLNQIRYFLPYRPHSLVILVSGHTASGTYRCEVSVEKSFYTLSSEKNVTVVGELEILSIELSC